ncbi:MAG: flagellar filament capping protein FliD [Deltaproteobacteria bacterium]|nr:flagellar filament capping protein FliD [Deltaproteobacteria bacterium]
MPITVGGIVSGIDTDSLIDKLVEAASVPMTVMEEDVDELEDLDDAYDELSELIEAAKTALEAIDSTADMRAATGTSSDEDAVAVTTDGTAVTGRYQIEVSQLAASETEVSQAYSDKDSTGVIPEGTLSITYAGTTTSLTIDSTNSSLSDLADLINESISGVAAYIMDTGDATSPYRLVIAGLDTGADNTITVDTSGLTGTSGTVPSFTETSTATDATLTVNGITITHPDNDVDGVVEGITFNINEVTTSAVTINVETDIDTTVANIQSFVDAYNAMRKYINTHRAYDSENSIKGEFVGESLVVNMMRSMQTAISSAYTTGSTYTSLASIGFETQQDGTIELDTEALEEALEASPGEVGQLFETDSGGFGDAFKALVEMYADEDEGFIATRQEAINDQIDVLEEDIEDFEERMAAYEERLAAQFLAMELAMAEMQDAAAQLEALLPSTSSNDDDD